MDNFFIGIAYAGAAAQPTGGGFQLIIMIAVFFLIMYFLIMRPQNKRNKEHRKMLESLVASDEIVTTGGVLGKISEVGEQFVTLEIGKNHHIKIQKQSVSALMPKGTYEQS